MLPLERLVNLGWHWLFRNLTTTEERDEFERDLLALGTEVVQGLRGRVWQDEATRRAPSWWVDDDEAAASTLAATGRFRR